MAAVNATADQVAQVLASAGLTSEVVLANRNAPQQVVVSGPTAKVRAAVVALKEAGLSARAIPVACAFHSPVVAGAVETFAEALAARPIAEPRIPVWSNLTAAPYSGDASQVRAAPRRADRRTGALRRADRGDVRRRRPPVRRGRPRSGAEPAGAGGARRPTPPGGRLRTRPVRRAARIPDLGRPSSPAPARRSAPTGSSTAGSRTTPPPPHRAVVRSGRSTVNSSGTSTATVFPVA